MTTRQLKLVHGHTIAELEHLLYNSCDLFDKDVTLEHEALGGWSNINIQGRSDDIDFVLKLPWAISSGETNPYLHLNDISLFFNKLGIAARPLSMGRLSTTKETPFIIFEYVHGVIHDSLSDLSTREILSLKECLQVLSRQKPPGLKKYKSQSDYLLATRALVENHVGFSTCSQDVTELIETFDDVYPKVLSFTDSAGDWSPSLMHGDLWIPNIVFQSGNVVLLDFEACAYGNHLYDLAYLLETPVSTTDNLPPGLSLPEEMEEVNSLKPLVLAFLVEWSIERLLSMESGLVEPNLATAESKTAIIEYVRSKTSRLKTIFLS
ncbi:MAG: aminoglycoside phosphotransferase family protein [Promethearchaeota archaeon]